MFSELVKITDSLGGEICLTGCKKVFLLVVLLAGFTLAAFGPAYAVGETAIYTATDGLKVVSYSRQWADIHQLKEVYIELLRNVHGEELKLLKRINIYPGSDPQGMKAAGRWYGEWIMKDGKPSLSGNRYIDLYNGDEFTTVPSIARTLAHEYGHHFTYYYFFKRENKLWENWRDSGMAAIRGLKNNSRVSASGSNHAWLIQEIAAEDYVQLFGSPSSKQSYDFKDIAERVNEGQRGVTYSTDIFNYRPQENYELPLAANVKGLKEYWLKAAGLTMAGSPPGQVSIELEDVNPMDRSTQYVFAWDKSIDDKTTALEYTLVYFEKIGDKSISYPVKTVTDNEPLEAVLGSAQSERVYMWEEVPADIAYFVLYIKDGDGLVTSSRVMAVDFSDPLNPEYVQIDDNTLSTGVWFPVRVKVAQKQLSFDVPPVIQNGRTMVPFRAVFEEMKASVDWDPSSQTIIATNNDTQITLRIGETVAFVNGEEVYLESPPVIRNGRTLIPLRFIGEALGADVSWNKGLQLVSITV